MNYIDINTSFGVSPKKNIDASVSSLIKNMEKHNIDMSLTYSLRGEFYDCSEGNKETLKVCKDDDSLIPAALFNPLKSAAIKGDIREIAESGFKAVRIISDVKPMNTALISYRKAFDQVNETGLPLIIECSPGCLYDIGKDFNIPVIFLSNHYYMLGEIIAVLEDRMNFYAGFRQFISPDAIEFFVDKIGSERLLFSTNSPFEYPLAPIFLLETSRIAQEHKQNIAYKNAERIFKL